MLIKRTLFFASLAFFGISTAVFGQQNGQGTQQPQQAQPESADVSDKDLEQFVVVYKQVQTENKNIQQKMVGTIEEEGMDINRYNELNQASANPNAEVDASKEEMEKYEKVTKKVETIQTDFQQKVKKMIEDEGMTLQRYQEVYTALQSDEDLKEKFNELMTG
ncbi:MAG: DUF4168 domain-containing protein [Brumimicrobium sp.]